MGRMMQAIASGALRAGEAGHPDYLFLRNFAGKPGAAVTRRLRVELRLLRDRRLACI